MVVGIFFCLNGAGSERKKQGGGPSSVCHESVTELSLFLDGFVTQGGDLCTIKRNITPI